MKQEDRPLKGTAKEVMTGRYIKRGRPIPWYRKETWFKAIQHVAETRSYGDVFTADEIAQETGIPARTVRWALRNNVERSKGLITVRDVPAVGRGRKPTYYAFDPDPCVDIRWAKRDSHPEIRHADRVIGREDAKRFMKCESMKPFNPETIDSVAFGGR